MSSPMMNRMFGLLPDCACAGRTAEVVAIAAVATASAVLPRSTSRRLTSLPERPFSCEEFLLISFLLDDMSEAAGSPIDGFAFRRAAAGSVLRTVRIAKYV